MFHIRPNALLEGTQSQPSEQNRIEFNPPSSTIEIIDARTGLLDVDDNIAGLSVSFVVIAAERKRMCSDGRVALEAEARAQASG